MGEAVIELVVGYKKLAYDGKIELKTLLLDVDPLNPQVEGNEAIPGLQRLKKL